jgi:hypothetical protein
VLFLLSFDHLSIHFFCSLFQSLHTVLTSSLHSISTHCFVIIITSIVDINDNISNKVHVSIIFKDQPIYDKSPDDEEHISTMIQMELLSSNPIYENYEAYYLERNGGYDIEITNKHLGFWYELNIQHDFQDLVATFMELICLKALNVTTFSMQSSCSCKYKLPIQFSLKKYLYFCVLLFSYKKKGYVVRHLLAWLYWQFHVT